MTYVLASVDFRRLWREYMNDRVPEFNLESVEILRAAARRASAEERINATGKVTAGRVRQTKGHLVLIGKIRAVVQRGNQEVAK